MGLPQSTYAGPTLVFVRPPLLVLTWYGGKSLLPTTTPCQYHLSHKAFEYLSVRSYEILNQLENNSKAGMLFDTFSSMVITENATSFF